jgi:hypothetical protein
MFLSSLNKLGCDVQNMQQLQEKEYMHTKLLSVNLEGKDQVKDVGIDGRII